jgi:hypothetical protein
MIVYPGQSAKSRCGRPSPTPCGLAARLAGHTLATKSGHKLCPNVPTGPCIGNDPASMADRFCRAVLLMPTFGKSAAWYQAAVPRFLGGPDDRHASPAGVSGLARIPGSNDA